MKKIIEISRLFEPGPAVACLLSLLLVCPAPLFAQTAPMRKGPGSLPAGVAEILTPLGESGAPGGSTIAPTTGGAGGEAAYGWINQIHVLGQVKSPGTYRVGSSARAAEMIAMAGGIAERGSLRSVEIRRSGAASETIDLFRFYEQGDLGANPFLQDNDVVFVPFQSKTVRIEGPVKKAGVYELSGETNVWDIIQLAGGFTVGAAQQGEIALVRYEEEKKQVLHIANVAEELRRAPIQNGDIVVVPHIFTKNKEFDYSFPNLPTDDVFYPSYNDQVYVAGAVLKPGPYKYEGHLTVVDYMNMAGPVPIKAKTRALRVIRPDGSEIKRLKKYTLSPGDTILIPEKKLTGNNVLTWYSTFASSLFTFVSLRSLLRDFD